MESVIQMWSSFQLTLIVVVLIENVNDNPPVFAESQYTLNVDEVSAYFFLG